MWRCVCVCLVWHCVTVCHVLIGRVPARRCASVCAAHVCCVSLCLCVSCLTITEPVTSGSIFTTCNCVCVSVCDLDTYASSEGAVWHGKHVPPRAAWAHLGARFLGCPAGPVLSIPGATRALVLMVRPGCRVWPFRGRGLRPSSFVWAVGGHSAGLAGMRISCWRLRWGPAASRAGPLGAGLDGGGGLAWGRLGPTCCLCVQVAFQRKSPPAPSLQPP